MSASSPPTTKYLGIRMPLDLYDKVEIVLDHDSTMLTEYIRGLVREDLRKRNLLTAGVVQPEPAEVAS